MDLFYCHLTYFTAYQDKGPSFLRFFHKKSETGPTIIPFPSPCMPFADAKFFPKLCSPEHKPPHHKTRKKLLNEHETWALFPFLFTVL